MDKRIHKNDKKVILYPGLVKRLIEKGMDALKEKDGKSAYDFFCQQKNMSLIIHKSYLGRC
ncbi:TPR repeat protein [Halalkalibacter wakoensis JCM 9140]|uniref:TPR repeat protein n=1 Tax=Halalkalibacter wakoensis JCM 9140 TaxID=1236970 RepID=W4Q287_9BACI|nr:hypothetical protein [Halalkalibacter wakoensis]GAE26186.1 TPR repeat protein [Halalkalibacter wakoensis JCM 9140]